MVYKKDGLIFKKSFFLNEEAIYLDTYKIEKCIKYIQDNGIKSIIINSQYGFKLNNVSFLIEVNYIEELIIETEIKKLDVSTINNLINFKSLIITGSIEQDINFENFSQLENINIIFNEHIVGVNVCISLKYIALWKCNGENLLLLLNNINI